MSGVPLYLQIRTAAPNIHAVAKGLYGVVRKACACNSANQVFFFFFITLKPRVE